MLKIMLKKFALWFATFGLSFLVSNVFAWIEQGKAFLYINIGSTVLNNLVAIVLLIIIGFNSDCILDASITALQALLITIGSAAFILLANWAISNLFNVGFFVTYQIITFGQCLCMENTKKEKE